MEGDFAIELKKANKLIYSYCRLMTFRMAVSNVLKIKHNMLECEVRQTN